MITEDNIFSCIYAAVISQRILVSLQSE